METEHKVKIGIDFDNVLFNTTKTWLDLYNQITGMHLQLSDIVKWDLRKIVPYKYQELALKLFDDFRLWENIKPLYNSQMYTKLLKNNSNIEVYIITATSPQTVNIKMQMLHKQYPWFDIYKDIIITQHKQMIKVDIMIDDYEENLKGGDYQGILLDYPWNQNFNEKLHGIVRCKDWSDIYDIIQSIT